MDSILPMLYEVIRFGAAQAAALEYSITTSYNQRKSLYNSPTSRDGSPLQRTASLEARKFERWRENFVFRLAKTRNWRAPFGAQKQCFFWGPAASLRHFDRLRDKKPFRERSKPASVILMRLRATALALGPYRTAD
jgi:hypothetical protein